jgi:hypothetical protein
VLPYLTIFGPHGKPDSRFPRMPNAPYRIDAAPSMPLNKLALDPIHAFYHNQNRSTAAEQHVCCNVECRWLDDGLFRRQPTAAWEWARQYTLADKFFMGAFGALSRTISGWCVPVLVSPKAGEHARAPRPAGKLIKAPDSPSAKTVQSGP